LDIAEERRKRKAERKESREKGSKPKEEIARN
jgi:hypothetical protein